MSRVSRQTTARIFLWPLALAVATLAGLVLGLTGDGWRDIAAWVLLGLTPLAIFRAMLRRQPDSSFSRL
ncbi:hypothetical protein Q9K01_01720 [Qipengyuania sp. DY56-A-20]|jgi:uncharacterized membrane protein YjjP (DUF1212 family)|uniref:DUF4175 domain-containing protein n=1 Tax=Qipengyuania benthica TaxID=3067651 RepID=A0ABT9H4X8_9SPHN|nr:hypothetical protein [Qipengyuania sp. DY56-A-20]MDP4538346.1 hypothetical protein [Qipengyuania sp. DY56-A-20]